MANAVAASVVSISDLVVPERSGPFVLIVARSRVNQVVVTRIAERCGLRPLDPDPDAALRELERWRPVTVIIDGGPDNRDGDALLPRLAELRRSSPDNLPSVILLSNAIRRPEDLHTGDTVDAVVAKPITPEALQPTILRLLELHRPQA